MSIKTIQETLKKARQKAQTKGIKKAEKSLVSTENYIKELGGHKTLELIAKRKRESLKELRALK